jgi:Zn finger protein HypA/HybF involved in hydrogenase expression
MQYPTIEEIQEVIVSGSYEGWCVNCGEWTHDSCEPDACKYECPACEQPTCYGAEELVIQGMVK